MRAFTPPAEEVVLKRTAPDHAIDTAVPYKFSADRQRAVTLLGTKNKKKLDLISGKYAA